MHFDWITWSIWLVGFLILVVWIWVPYREFKRLHRDRAAAKKVGPPRDSKTPISSVDGGND